MSWTVEIYRILGKDTSIPYKICEEWLNRIQDCAELTV